MRRSFENARNAERAVLEAHPEVCSQMPTSWQDALQNVVSRVALVVVVWHLEERLVLVAPVEVVVLVLVRTYWTAVKVTLPHVACSQHLITFV